jgi:uncharacterized membrane protein
MASGTLLGLLKIVHVLFVAMGIGGVITQNFLVRKFRTASVNEAAASERMALAVARFMESYGLLLALLSGLPLGVLTGDLARGYLHAKILAVIFLLGLSHVDLRRLKRMIALREAGKAQEVDRVKQTHLLFAAIESALILVIVALAVMKPF